MRQKIRVVTKRDNGRPEYDDGVLFIDELPPVLRRGRNKAGKRRQGKRRRQDSAPVE